MKSNRKKLVIVQLFSALGNAVVGVFLPFLFGRAFDLETWEILLILGAGLQFASLVVVYPVNKILRKFKTKNIIRLGVSLQAIFLALLVVAPNNLLWAVLVILCYLLFVVIYWPSWHVAILNSSRDGTRGRFAGNIQIVGIAANLVAPLLSGYFLEMGWDDGVLGTSILMFLLSIWATGNVDLPMQKLSNFPTMWRVFVDKLWKTKHLCGMASDAIQSATLHLIWPIFLGVVLGSFTKMGIVVAISALAEIISSNFFGKLTDKRSARKVLNVGQWFRGVDIGFRAVLMWMPSIWTAGMVSVMAGVLGPVFNISSYGRTCEIAEKVAPKELEWFIAREWVLGVVRGLFFAIAAGAVYMWGEMILGWFLMFAGVASIGYRKY